MMYRWVGWFDGSADCEPPEPGKYWIEIQEDVSTDRTSYLDPWFEEVCIIVHRVVGSIDFELDNSRPEVLEKERRAQYIVDALNYAELHSELMIT